MRTLLSNRDAVGLAQVRRFIVGTLSTDQAENIGEVIYVDGTAGNDAYDGKSPDRAKRTIAGGLAVAVAYDVVAVFPGTYAEHVTMAVANVSLVGLGDKPSQVLLYSTAAVDTPMVNITASNCVVANLRVSLGHASNVRCISIAASNCLIEDCEFVKAAAADLDVGVALVGPSTNADNTIRRCLFSGHVNGITFVVSTTQQAGACIERCIFINGVTTDIFDVTANAVTLLRIVHCDFLGAPAKFIEVDQGGCTGLIADCLFNYATHAIAVIKVEALGAGIKTVSNLTIAGRSTAVAV